MITFKPNILMYVDEPKYYELLDKLKPYNLLVIRTKKVESGYLEVEGIIHFEALCIKDARVKLKQIYEEIKVHEEIIGVFIDRSKEKLFDDDDLGGDDEIRRGN